MPFCISNEVKDHYEIYEDDVKIIVDQEENKSQNKRWSRPYVKMTSFEASNKLFGT